MWRCEELEFETFEMLTLVGDCAEENILTLVGVGVVADRLIVL